MPSSSSATATRPVSASQLSTTAVIYKGKFTRSWPQLPDELVRHIATFYLWDLCVTSYCPQVWETRELWHHRMVYTSIRDAILLEKNLMSICPQWSKALESHLFWHHAIALIDPFDYLAHHAIVHPPKPPLPSDTRASSTADTQTQEQPTHLTPYCHFRNILTYSCFVCRINQPNSSVGLTIAKRLIPSPLLGTIALCREHDRRRAAFCGICLRETPLFEGAAIPPSLTAAGVVNPNTALAAQQYSGMSLETLVSCLENEDEETWPGVAATCRICRREWLWRKVAGNPRDRDAIGGSRMVSEDWETRQCVEGFIDLAEGSISDVVGLAREKWWLRRYTKLGDMMLQALAAARFTSAPAAVAAAAVGGRRTNIGEDGEYTVELEEEEEEDEEDEEDPELMQLTEEGGVRELALGDWARSRILDGHWFSPADLWYGNVMPGKPIAVPALHPCPWAREELGLDMSEATEEHPRPLTVRAEMPPSYALCDQAYVAHQRQMRVVLLPAMKNIVRRLVIECAEDSSPSVKGDCSWGGYADDPAIRASKMSLEDVLTILREEEGVWFDGVDWAERRRNDARSRGEGEQEKKEGDQKASETSGNSPTSTTGSSSSAMSDSKSDITPREGEGEYTDDPIPQPALSHDGSKVPVQGVKPGAPPLPPRPSTRPVTIAVSPILNPPRLLRPIPYVPTTLSHLPQYSLEAFRAVWREACAPLYHCRCKICDRAMAKANADAAANAQTNGNVPVSSQAPETRQSGNNNPRMPIQPHQGLKKPVEIKLDEVAEVDGEGEEEVELEEFEHEDDEVGYDEYEEEDDLEVSSTYEEYGERESYSPSSFPRAATPQVVPEGEEDLESEPAEQRHEHRTSRLMYISDDDSSSSAMHQSRKRSCDELDEDTQVRCKKEDTPPKRARKGDATMSPALAVGRTNPMRKRSSEELDDDDDDDDDHRCESGHAGKKGKGNGYSSERGEDVPHKRLKIGNAVDESEGLGRSGSLSPPPTTDSITEVCDADSG
ncbi:hypothetical protein AX17_001614 [Amanita inopinata Kibby_2008]|nr:hypothetical protein AX17_007456 [Amanita inopinata Kibby_2008]KAF8639248.1 hypothetical protein AX17_001614 [Amanita inopinata Kibby_2008]